MKTLFFITIGILSLSLMKASSDDEHCEENFFLTNGSKWVYNTYNKKNKLAIVETLTLDTVLFFEDRTEFITKSIHKYPNPETGGFAPNTNQTSTKYICINGKISMDMSYTYGMSGQTEQSDTILKIKHDDANLKYPSEFKQGMTLPDVHYAYEQNGKVHSKLDITNRYVEKLVTIDIKQRSFECALITYNNDAETYGISYSTTVKEWYSLEIGIVKQEVYKKGKLKMKKVLVDFER